MTQKVNHFTLHLLIDKTRYFTTIHPRCGLVYDGSGCHFVIKVWKPKTSHSLCQQGIILGAEAFPSNGRGVLCPYTSSIMHFWQYLHQTFFLLRIDQKPLKCLAIVSNAYKWRRRYISMLQDFHFKIIHRAGAKHANVDVLSRNLVGKYGANENFGSKI